MTDASLERTAAHSPGLVLATYTASVFLSALLLFGVQPMFTRMVLPELGGSPSVWSIAMVFFQTMLLAGYAYAHWLAKAKTRLVPVLVHLALLCAAGLTLPLSIAHGWGEPPASGTAFWLLGLFTISIGLPFFALAANNPLLQTWFVRTGHHDGKDPYFLYAASNVGSFLALLSYPILLEPAFSLHTQDQLWSVGFVALAVLIGSCGYLLLRSPPMTAIDSAAEAAAPMPNWLTLGRWVFISAVPSGLLVAVTAHISTDIAAAPLLWVMPLSLYLLTWVLVFARKPVFSQPFMLLMQPFAIAAIIALLLYAGRVTLIPSLSAHLFAFFVIAMACHGELARSRPAPKHLTAFYVSLSLGGMIGGLFAGLVAPYTFSWIAEYPILTVLAVLCRPFRPEPWPELQSRIPQIAKTLWDIAESWFWPAAAVVALALILPSFLDVKLSAIIQHRLYVIVWALAVISIALYRDPPKSALVVALAFAAIRLYQADVGRSQTVRSFFGVNLVYETTDRHFRVLMHGTTIHGAQRLMTADGRAVTGRPEPLTYYHRDSAMANVIRAVRARSSRPMRVAVIGLGAGSLACYIEPNEKWRFFEIDSTVIEIARNPKFFNFISACAPDLPIVPGDARLTFAKVPDGTYDLIIVDAYSSDAIPVHLATREAMAIYKSKLAPHGVVTMHISNRHLELRSVVAGIAAANGLKTWLWNSRDERANSKEFVSASDVVIAARQPEDIGALGHSKKWGEIVPNPSVRTWTDDYSNIAGALLRRYLHPY